MNNIQLLGVSNFPAETDQISAATNEALERIGAGLASLLIGHFKKSGF
jgi:hypothetical protein